MKNILYDAIIIGDTLEAKVAANELSSKFNVLHILNNTNFTVANSYQQLSDKLSIISSQPVIWVDYRNNMARVELANRERYCAKFLLLTPGMADISRNANTCYSESLLKPSKRRNLVVASTAHDDRLPGTIARLTKKFKQVYLCIPDMQTPALKDRYSNLTILYNTKPNAVKNLGPGDANRNGGLVDITMNTYNTIRAQCLFRLAEQVPATKEFVGRIETDINGYIITDKNGQCSPYNNFYAAGKCTENNISINDVISVISKNLAV